MAPAACHRLAERGRVSRRFVHLASTLLCLALVPLMDGGSLDTYQLVIGAGRRFVAVGLLVLAAPWFGLSYFGWRLRRW